MKPCGCSYVCKNYDKHNFNCHKTPIEIVNGVPECYKPIKEVRSSKNEKGLLGIISRIFRF